LLAAAGETKDHDKKQLYERWSRLHIAMRVDLGVEG
jgi:hypothetical protein